MILYTNQDPSLIFPDDTPPSASLMIDSHTILDGIKTEQGFVINSLRSTDIKQYLNSKYSPGSIINL